MQTAKLLAALGLAAATASSQRFSSYHNEWKRVGPESGIVAATVADPGNPSTLYAGTCGGSLFKTVDGGASWHALDALPTFACNPNALMKSAVLALDPRNSAIGYTANCSDIFKTTDGGATWSLVSSLRLPVCLQDVMIGNRGTLFASRGHFSSSDLGEIQKSTDGGLTWTPFSSGFTLLALDPQDEQTMYASGAGFALYKSTDGGASWNKILAGPPVVSGLVIDPRDPSTLYARAHWEMLKSVDAGAHWTTLNLGVDPPQAQSSEDGLRALAISPPNPSRIYAVVNRFSDTPATGPRLDFFLVISSDGGMTWTTSNDPHLTMADLLTILPDAQDENTVYLGTTSGVLKSTDAGAHWHFANPGLQAEPARQVVSDRKSGALFTVADAATVWHGTPLFKSTDAGRSWSPSSAGLNWGAGDLIADPQNPFTLYTEGPHNGGAGSFFGSGVFKSQDGGASWSEIWYDATWGAGLYPIVMDQADPAVLYAGVSICPKSCDSRIARSDDAGRTWKRSPAPLSTEEYISALAIDPRNANVVYAGTADGGGWGTGGLFKSVDGGVNWRKLSDGAVYQLLIDTANPDMVAGPGLSTDAGETWRPLNMPCDPYYYGALAFDPRGSGALYCGDNGKVFRTVNAGKSWSQVGVGLRGRVESLAFGSPDSTTLYAATSGGTFALVLTSEEPAHATIGASRR